MGQYHDDDDDNDNDNDDDDDDDDNVVAVVVHRYRGGYCCSLTAVSDVSVVIAITLLLTGFL